MRKITTAAVLMLLALLCAAPGALAQTITDHDGVTDPRYDSPETDAANTELSDLAEEYAPAKEQLDTMTDGRNELNYESEEVRAVKDQVESLNDRFDSAESNLATARLDAIEAEPLPPGGELEELRREVAALTVLRGWAGDRIGSEMGHPEVDAIQELLDAHRGTVEDMEAQGPASPEPAASSEPAQDEGGGATPAPQTGTTGPGLFETVGSGISSLFSFVFSIIFYAVLAATVMFALAWRRLGSAPEAAASLLAPKRLALILLLAVFLTVLGDYLMLALIALAVLFGLLWRREGSAGGAFAKLTAFIPRSASTEHAPTEHPGHRPPPGPTVGGDAHDAGDAHGDNDPRPALVKYCRNVTEEARQGLIEEAIGRADEIEAIVEALTRRKVNNVVLTGEAGVGKTALVEELGRKLVAGRVPPPLVGKELLELRVTALKSGTSLIGQFPARVNSLIEEIKAQPDRYILFVDEMHTLMGAGKSLGNNTGAGDMFKPPLARGELRMIGATTADEFQQIEEDPAMARRFEKVHIRPLTVEETVEVLRRVKGAQEEHYNLRVEDEALEAAAKLSDRYITDQQLPAKAINVLETACSRVALRNGNEVTAEDVAAVVSRRSGVPVGGITGDERERIRNVEAALKERMVGQEEAVKAVADAVRRKRGGFGAGRPASFGFFGVTGVGKTELAKALAEVLFGDEDAMVRLDMSEYAHYNGSWKMIGAAKGYTGSESGGTLTEPVRRKPYSVVLLDEIEKASPDTLDPLLSILDDGRITDGAGRFVDFKNTMVIMTSNLAADIVTDAWEQGERVSEDEMREALVARGLRPELVQRLGKIATFAPPEPEDVLEICRRMLSKTAKSVKAEHSIEVSFTEEAIEHLAKQGYDPANGLRPLRRVIERQVEDRLSDLILDDKVRSGDRIELALKEDGTPGFRATKNRAPR